MVSSNSKVNINLSTFYCHSHYLSASTQIWDCHSSFLTILFLRQDEEETWVIDENDVQSTFSPWKSSLTVKLAVIFLFTQVTVNLFHESSGVYSSDTLLSKLLQSIWPRQILIGRIAQILTVNAFYVWRLYCAEDWTWSEWFNWGFPFLSLYTAGVIWTSAGFSLCDSPYKLLLFSGIVLLYTEYAK